MEHSINIPDIDDARDMFLLAKDRLLDINDWNTFFTNGSFNIELKSNKGEKLHRDARTDDMVHIAATNNTGISTESWAKVKQIQYDFFPDIRSESISLLLTTSNSPSGNGIESEHVAYETILIKREQNIITVHCNAGNELPMLEDEYPDEHINSLTDLHPVISIPTESLSQLLYNIISPDRIQLV